MVERLHLRWFQEVMLACQELEADDLEALQRLEPPRMDGGGSGGAAAGEACSALQLNAPPAPSSGSGEASEEVLEAIRWATGVRDDSVVLVIAEALAPAERQEQLQLYRSRDAAPRRMARARTLVHPQLLKSRMQVAGAYHGHLQEWGWVPGARRPREASQSFLNAWDWGPWSKRPSKSKLKNLRRWHAAWLKAGHAGAGVLAPTGCRGARRGRRPAGAEALAISSCRRSRGGGRAAACAWLRQALFEWWSGMRHSVDWTTIKRGCPSFSQEPKKLARFTQAMLTQKASELIASYCSSGLKEGCKPRPPQLSPAWWKGWRREYGLSMKHPNRRFKVQRVVLMQRLERGWLNVFRVRAACQALLGYEPEMENFDESPFHHNETGSANTKTLTVAGKVVPLLEAHGQTRLRWSANFMAWSDEARVLQQGPPPVECMFRASGGGAQMRHKYAQHIRSRGHGSWVTASASKSGSYKVQDVLDFLKLHLPEQQGGPQQRPWRILLADDASAHKDPRVAKLCWSRGYVYMVHGGGVTPVVQVVDTHFNQHAKRKYLQKEGVALLRQMSLGRVVPSLRAVDCIDLMVEVCKDRRLHVTAARGFVETGFKVNLDDALLDTQITKEARYFWDHLGMREKVASAVREVREEVRAGRLKWTYIGIQRLVLPHPHHADDDVLERVGDHFDDAEGAPIQEDSSGGEDDASEAGSGHDSECRVDADMAAEDDLADWTSANELQGDGGCTASAAAETAALALPAGVTEAQKQDALGCVEMMHMYQRVADELQSWGDVSGAAYIEKCRDKERRRMRGLCKEDPGVLAALTQLEDLRRAAELAQRRQHEEARQRKAELLSIGRELKATKKKVLAERKQLKDALACKEQRRQLTLVSPSELGDGKKNAGGNDGKKARVKVLDRVSWLGAGLSPAQRNEFAWFCEEWDGRCLSEHGEAWPKTFATWMQGLLNRLESGQARAVSEFVLSETRRCLSHSLALALPPVPSAAAAAAARAGTNAAATTGRGTVV